MDLKNFLKPSLVTLLGMQKKMKKMTRYRELLFLRNYPECTTENLKKNG